MPYRLWLFFLFLAFCPLLASPAQAQTFGCTPAMANDIVCENSKPGNPSSQWDVSSGDAGRSQHSGLCHRHQRRSGRDDFLQGKDQRFGLHPQTSTGWGTTRAMALA